MITLTQTVPDNPFTLDQEFPFLDAAIVQSVTIPTMLQWEHQTGGFFTEAENALPGLELETIFVTKEGKRVPGFGAKSFPFYPVAFRNWWEIGEPGKQQRLATYQDGAHSRTQALGLLKDGTLRPPDGGRQAQSGVWIILTARGLASQSLISALRSHRFWTGRTLRAQPFAVPILAKAGEVRKEGTTYVTEFIFSTLETERCPEELGWKVRERWDEVQAWIGSEAYPLGQENKHAPVVSPPAPEEFEAEDGPTTPPLKYGDKSAVDMGNADEVKAFQAYQAQKNAPPASRAALRQWVRDGRK